MRRSTPRQNEAGRFKLRTDFRLKGMAYGLHRFQCIASLPRSSALQGRVQKPSDPPPLLLHPFPLLSNGRVSTRPVSPCLHTRKVSSPTATYSLFHMHVAAFLHTTNSGNRDRQQGVDTIALHLTLSCRSLPCFACPPCVCVCAMTGAPYTDSRHLLSLRPNGAENGASASCWKCFAEHPPSCQPTVHRMLQTSSQTPYGRVQVRAEPNRTSPKQPSPEGEGRANTSPLRLVYGCSCRGELPDGATRGAMPGIRASNGSQS